MLTAQEKDAGIEEDEKEEKAPAKPQEMKDLEDTSEYGVHVAPGHKAYIIGPGGGKRRKKIDRKFLFKIIRAQQLRLNFFAQVINQMKDLYQKEKDLRLQWQDRCNELVQQAHARDQGIEVVKNPLAVDRINQGAKNAK